MFKLTNNETLKEKFRVVMKDFIYPTAEIYGGEKGLYDYGMDAEEIMNNIRNEWRNFFVSKEKMLIVKCTMLTPEKVLKASGHVDRFNDFLVKDLVNGESYRADHLIEKSLEDLIKNKAVGDVERKEVSDIIQKIDNFGEEELQKLIEKFNIKSPDNNYISAPKPFNLMFSTSIGPSSEVKGYLRPETAQGIFINFKRLLNKKKGKLPFAVAQVGSSFRNEIAPRSGLLRVREFEMAEIEHFLDPLDKSHPKFVDVAHLNINMFPSKDQMTGGSVSSINLGEAVAAGLVANETLGYFVGRIYLFLTKIGIKHDFLRFRQHMPNEMAHYATDCWDAECLTSYGWIECVGCADRSCYDLERHSECSGTRLVAQRPLPTPVTVKSVVVRPSMKVMGSVFRKDAPLVAKYLQELPADEASRLLREASTVTVDGREFTLRADMAETVEEEKVMQSEEFVPSVIEPSFGLGRIFYSLLEQNFDVREDDANRTLFTLPPRIAAYKFSVLPLSSAETLQPVLRRVEAALDDLDLMYLVDDSGASIGRRYARTDVIGVPFGITIDFDSVTVAPASVTVRERDSRTQIRVALDDLATLAGGLAKGTISWEQVRASYPEFTGQSNE